MGVNEDVTQHMEFMNHEKKLLECEGIRDKCTFNTMSYK